MSISPEAERQYWAASRGIGLADLSDGGRLLMKGSDSLDLLHRLTTQDLLALQPGQGATTVLTSDKGRIVDLVTCYLFPDHLLLLTSPGNSQAVLEWIDKYTIIEDAETTDVTDSTGLLRFFGPNAGRLAQRLISEEAEELPRPSSPGPTAWASRGWGWKPRRRSGSRPAGPRSGTKSTSVSIR